MPLQSTFQYSFKIWFLIHIFVNMIGMVFIDSSPTHEGNSHSFGRAYLTVNAALIHLALLYLYYKHERIQQTNKPFHEWIWLTDDICTRYLVGGLPTIALIPGIMVLSHMDGVTYLLGGWFVVTLVFWTVVVSLVIHSSVKEEDNSTTV